MDSKIFLNKYKMEKYNLTWHTYTDHLKAMSRNLMKDKDSQDVTLVCDDKVLIKAHKIVLKSCSPVFEKMLENTRNDTIVYLRGISHIEMESILEFMYLGEATFYPDRINEFFKVAQDLEVGKELNEDVNLVVEDINSESDHGSSVEEKDLEDKNYTVDATSSYEDTSERSMAMTGNPVLSGQFQCPDCGKGFSDRNGVFEHHRSVHQNIIKPLTVGEEVLIEDKENSVAATSVSVHEMKEDMAVINDPVFFCHECGKEFKTDFDLTGHRKLIHGIHRKRKQSYCSYCDYRARDHTDFKKHTKSQKHLKTVERSQPF